MSRIDTAKLFQAISNAGRWGPDDELGTLNLITPDTVRRAARLVRSGHVVSIAHDLDTAPSRKNHMPVVHHMLFKSHREPATAIDELLIAPHSVTITHLDAVAHSHFRGRVYNGREMNDVISQKGLSFGSISAMRDGIVTRGVFLDIAAVRERPWLEPDDVVQPEDLERAERAAGVRVGSGDALLVRVGLAAREAARGDENPAERAGLSTDCVQWFADREVALYGGDCFEHLPTRDADESWPLHRLALAGLGLALLDNVAVEPLVQACAREGSAEFLFTVAPLRAPGATGCAVNPLCVF